jgi:hypothetical protein
MGSPAFTPAPRTAPTMVTDQRDYINTTSQRIKADVKDKIVFWEPEAAPLTVMTKRLNKTREVSQYQFDMLEKEPLPRLVTVSGAQTSGDTSVELTSGHGGRVAKYYTLRNMRTGEVVWCSSVSTDTLTVTRGIGGYADSMADGDVLEITGSAYEDGSSKGTFKSVKETRNYNYTQIIRTGYGFTGRQMETGLYGGKDPMTERKAQAIEHRKSIEKTMIWGQRHTTTGPNGKTLSFMGGLNAAIQTNVWNCGGNEPTERQFNEMLEHVFRHGEGGNVFGPGNKIMMASPRWQTIIESWGRDKVRYTQGESTLGLKVGKYESVHGVLSIVRQPLFVGKDAQFAFILDPNHMWYVYHQGRDTKLIENIQANDVDGAEEEYLTDCSAEYNLEAAFARLENIPV